MASTIFQIELMAETLFNTFVNVDTNDDIRCTVHKCKSVARIFTGLTYYQTNGQATFSEFLLKIYKNYLNDINHIITIHDKELEIINESLLRQSHYIPCDVDKCLLSDRHCQINDGKNGNVYANKKKMDPISQFHQETWDNVHFYLIHLFELGMRQRNEDKQEEEESKEEKKEDNDNIIDDKWGCFDKQFKKQGKMIQSTRQKFPRISGRFQPTSNKFTIETLSDESKNEYPTVEGTLMDALEKRFNNDKDISAQQVDAFKQFVDAEEFDSDAVMEDIEAFGSENNKQKSNILQATKDNQLCTSIYDYVKELKFKGKAFSTGFSFFYWSHFGAKDEERRIEIEENRNDYGGYSQVELFIEKGKYLSLKEEILSNNDNEVGIKEYNSIIIKTKQYMETERVKEMKCDFDEDGWDDVINFEIKQGTQVSQSHIASLLFYTDFSQLSTSFSRTFRRVEAGESIDGVKQRNMCYWWMSKFIIEAVNCFGINGDTDESGESGPFFCGLGIVINVPSFRIRLTGPTSTSKEIIVAQNFAKDNGIILQLNNQVDGLTKYLKMFNVSFMSRYKEENERIFIHGQYSIEISSIRLTSNWNNFSKFLK
eukprot:377145_1